MSVLVVTVVLVLTGGGVAVASTPIASLRECDTRALHYIADAFLREVPIAAAGWSCGEISLASFEDA